MNISGVSSCVGHHWECTEKRMIMTKLFFKIHIRPKHTIILNTSFFQESSLEKNLLKMDQIVMHITFVEKKNKVG